MLSCRPQPSTSTSTINNSNGHHHHRRKAATPLRAPEAASPEWYNEVQLPLLVARLLNTSSHSSRDHHRRCRSSSPCSTTSASETATAATTSSGCLAPPPPDAEAEVEAAENLVCSKCSSVKTPMWRRMSGVLLCNACGLRARRAAATRTRLPRCRRRTRRTLPRSRWRPLRSATGPAPRRRSARRSWQPTRWGPRPRWSS